MKPTVTLATCHTEEGTLLTLLKHDRDHYLMVGGVQLMSTNACLSEQYMAELACATLPPKPRVLIGGLGFGFTLRKVLEMASPKAIVEVAELLPEIIAWNRSFLRDVNGHLLDDPRVVLQLKDVFDLVKGEGQTRYHVILLDVDNSPDPLVQQGNARLYNPAGLIRIKNSLHPGGRVVFWSANRDDYFANALRQVFVKVECIAAKSYAKAKRPVYTLFVADRD